MFWSSSHWKEYVSPYPYRDYGRTSRLSLRFRQLRSFHALRLDRTYNRLERCYCRSRRHWLGHAHRDDRNCADRYPRRRCRVLQPSSFSRCRGSRYLLVGDPLCVRPTRYEKAAGRKLLSAAIASPGYGHRDGIVVLRQFPSGPQLAGLALVVAGVALHRSEIRS
jgi:hypothetical protein